MKCSPGISNFLEEISHAYAQSLQSWLSLWDPMDYRQVPLSIAFSKVRILEWLAITLLQGIFSIQVLNPWHFLCLLHCRLILYHWATWEALKRSLVFLILLFSSISLHCLLRKCFLSLLAILWNSALKWVYLSFPFCLLLLFFSQLFVMPPQATILPFCISFSWGWFWSLPPIMNLRP